MSNPDPYRVVEYAVAWRCGQQNAYAREFTLRDAEKCIEDLSEQTRELRAYRERQTIRNAVAFVWLVVLTVVAWMLGG